VRCNLPKQEWKKGYETVNIIADAMIRIPGTLPVTSVHLFTYQHFFLLLP